MEFVLLISGISLAWCVVWGCVTKHINENKGYYGGFAWGFWLGFIGLIVVLTKQDNRRNYEPVKTEYEDRLSAYSKEMNDKKILSNGGWKCNKCGNVNGSYVTTCSCGLGALENKNYNNEKTKEGLDTNALIKLKELVDKGVITEQEFEAKKKEMLGL